MLNIEQLNQSFGEYQLKQIKVNGEYEKRISDLLKRVHVLEEVRKVQIKINKQLLEPKKSWWERVWK